MQSSTLTIDHWMLGVDVADQRIAYYHPNLRCHRTWIPMFLQLLSMMRNNMYVIYNDWYGKDGLTHKDFTIEIVNQLMILSEKERQKETENNEDDDLPFDIHIMTSPSVMSRVSALSCASTIAARSKASSSSQTHPVSIPHTSRTVMHGVEGILSQYRKLRFSQSRQDHKAARQGSLRKGCLYCKALVKDRLDGGERLNWDRVVKKTNQTCSVCSVYLCKNHFSDFHDDF
jgi:hypothetical protein